MSVVAEEITNSAGLTDSDVQDLNEKYAALSFEARIQELYTDFNVSKVMVTSSFAATSAYFLHIISRIRPDQKIYFIDTGFHFQETQLYKQYLTELYGLHVVSVQPEEWKHDYTEREKVYQSDPDFCCSINKVEPLEALKPDFHVWVSSLMRWQTDHRSTLEIFESRRGIIRFHPMLDVSKEDRDNYIREHNLPFHPLVAKGYSSIGCTHCTLPGDDRSGRWGDKPKTECGLHT